MPIVVSVQEGIDFTKRAKIPEAVLISQRRSGGASVEKVFVVGVLIMIGFGVPVVVLCSTVQEHLVHTAGTFEPVVNVVRWVNSEWGGADFLSSRENGLNWATNIFQKIINERLMGLAMLV